MKVAVIIPTIGRPELQDALRSLRTQTQVPDEIVVEHDTNENGPAATRNNAARRTHADILLFLDDDCVAAPNWVERMVTVFNNDPSVTAVSGAVIYRTQDHVPGHDERVVQNPDARWFMGANCGVRREAFWKIGGFPEKYRVYEDKAFALACWMKNYVVARAPTASVYHTASHWDDNKVKKFSDHLSWWIELMHDYDVWTDQNNPPPIVWKHFLMPRDFGAIIKSAVKAPRNKIYRLRFRLLITQRVYLWRAAFRARKFII